MTKLTDLITAATLRNCPARSAVVRFAPVKH